MAEPLDVVQRFWIALQTGDTAGAVALLADDVEWRNSGLPTMRGAKVGATLEALDRRGVAVEMQMHHIAESGEAVLTDRTDAIRLGRFSTAFPVQGTFRVRDGRIVLWDDHFTWGSVTLASVVGLTGSIATAMRGLLSRR